MSITPLDIYKATMSYSANNAYHDIQDHLRQHQFKTRGYMDYRDKVSVTIPEHLFEQDETALRYILEQDGWVNVVIDSINVSFNFPT